MEKETKKILLAIDGSRNSERALLEASNLGEDSNAEIKILTAIKPLFLPYYGNVGILKRDNEALEKSKKRLLENSLEFFEDYPGKVKTVLRKGDPAEEILAEAEENDYHLIVMGSKGLGVFTRALLGSVSTKVLNHTETNVYIVK
ncbi:MAG: universal stress protein [Atopostipes suicloacalis]|nr:universal stress protein [Atopostipes suicloacalis]